MHFSFNTVVKTLTILFVGIQNIFITFTCNQKTNQMRKETHTFNGTPVTYKVSEDSTYYGENTPDALIEVLERARVNKTRLKFYLGDNKTGKDWMEEDSKMGKVGRSMGPIKIPLLIKTVASQGGGALMDGNIVKVATSPAGIVVYQHPNYHQPEMRIVEDGGGNYSHAILIDGGIYSRHESLISAKRLFSKLS